MSTTRIPRKLKKAAKKAVVGHRPVYWGTTLYRGFTITEVFKYSDGTSDFETQEENYPERGGLYWHKTLAHVKNEIDETLNERES